MNPDKAREYFSAYYEGTLEQGLSETLERAFRSDAQIQAEYRSFERLMQGLEVLQNPAPEPEIDLHELISRRLDRHIYEQKRRVGFPLTGLWKSIALGGLATVALATAVLQLQPGVPGSGKTSTASIVPVEILNKVELISTEKGYALEYHTKDSRILTVRSADGAVLTRQSVDAGTLICPLANPNETSKLLQVEVLGEKELSFVALPGTRLQPAGKGEGTVKDLALALAGFHRVPVVVAGNDESKIEWQLTPGDGLAAAEKALSPTSYSIHKSPDGILSIQQN